MKTSPGLDAMTHFRMHNDYRERAITHHFSIWHLNADEDWKWRMAEAERILNKPVEAPSSPSKASEGVRVGEGTPEELEAVTEPPRALSEPVPTVHAYIDGDTDCGAV